MYKRPHHQRIHAVLSSMDAEFLAATHCCFGGGTCLALRLGEYRDSLDMDFLCASSDGYRTLRGTVTNLSLGDLFETPPKLMREIRFDRHGIRTVLEVDDTPIKFEVVLEGRVRFGCERIEPLPVPVIDRIGLFTEKLLANSDRHADRSVYSRDIIDLMVMIDDWGAIPREAWSNARSAYGKAVKADFDRAIEALRGDPGYVRECFETLDLDASARRMIRERWLNG